MPRLVKILSVRTIHEGALVQLEGVDNRDVAQTLAGARLAIRSTDVPPTASDELYVYELEGFTAKDAAGVVLGQVRQVVDNAGQDLLVLDSPVGERLFPLVPQTLVGFDRDERVVTLRVPEGLWD